ncbi:MAG: hypothetical protein COT26_00360, partial [Candidatus Kerfeldbacteria bacterium CG08_land_8_20_14_0_20_43_14]
IGSPKDPLKDTAFALLIKFKNPKTMLTEIILFRLVFINGKELILFIKLTAKCTLVGFENNFGKKNANFELQAQKV